MTNINETLTQILHYCNQRDVPSFLKVRVIRALVNEELAAECGDIETANRYLYARFCAERDARQYGKPLYELLPEPQAELPPDFLADELPKAA